jgi:hypothetical protein
MSDRGDYRAIHSALLDGPDFQRLSPEARWALICLKVTLGPSGINKVPGVLAVLAERTGYTEATVKRCLGELEGSSAPWIAREHNVVWVVRALEFEPSLNLHDRKHRISVQKHASSLPRVEVVGRFMLRYREWFTEDGTPEGTPTEPLQRVIEGPTKALGSTENREPRTEDRILLGPSGDGPMEKSSATPITPLPWRDGATEQRGKDYPPDFEAAWSALPRRPNDSKRDAWKAWRARRSQGVPAADLLEGARRYGAFLVAGGKAGTEYQKQTATFFGPGEHYAQTWDPATANQPRAAPRTEAETPLDAPRWATLSRYRDNQPPDWWERIQAEARAAGRDVGKWGWSAMQRETTGRSA